jgi:Saxitoxin biosynthesis operon protein SxtJ
MAHETLQRDETVKLSSNRVFGFVFAAVFLVVGLLPLLSHGSVRLWSLIVSGAFLLVALIAPAVLAPLNRLWMRFGMLLHRIVSPLVLGIMFFGVITPMGLVMRLMGKDLLRLRADPNASSYWVRRTPPGPARDSFKHQF